MDLKNGDNNSGVLSLNSKHTCICVKKNVHLHKMSKLMWSVKIQGSFTSNLVGFSDDMIAFIYQHFGMKFATPRIAFTC